MSRSSSVILLSGGLDSAANLAYCVHHDLPVAALTFRYGQHASLREVEAAEKLCEHYEVEHRIVDLAWLGAIGGSTLTENEASIPELSTHQLDDMGVTRESAKSVWVPNRNGVFLNVAAALAERLKAKRVVVGFNREEAATFPDNSIDFIRRSTAALALSTANQVEIFCYTAAMDKREIVQSLRKLDATFPFHLVWSCYHGGQERCGRCESCRRNLRAMAG